MGSVTGVCVWEGGGFAKRRYISVDDVLKRYGRKLEKRYSTCIKGTKIE